MFTEMANNVDLQTIKSTQFHIIYFILETKICGKKGGLLISKNMSKGNILHDNT